MFNRGKSTIKLFYDNFLEIIDLLVSVAQVAIWIVSTYLITKLTTSLFGSVLADYEDTITRYTIMIVGIISGNELIGREILRVFFKLSATIRAGTGKIKAKLENIEEILVEFAGANEIITKEEIKSFISSEGGNTQGIDSIIDLLFNALFLGLELSENDFKFLVSERDKNVLFVRARKFQNNEAKQRFLINTPFQKTLGISPLLPT